MKRFNGGNEVAGGYYLNLSSWEVTTIGGELGRLPGNASSQYVHVPLPALFVLAPVMGAAFAIFLPFLGFAMPVYALGKKLVGASAKAMNEVASTMTPGWQPGEAYLAGKGEKKDEKKDATESAKAEEPELEKLAKEIEEKRAEKK